MGHSEAFKEASSIAVRILRARDARSECNETFRLFSGREVSFSWGKTWGSLYFRELSIDEEEAGLKLIPDLESLKRWKQHQDLRKKRACTAYERERLLLISTNDVVDMVKSRRPWQIDIRKAQQDGMCHDIEGEGRLPFLARNGELVLNRKSTEQEITLQLYVLFWQWGMLDGHEMAADDKYSFIEYICSQAGDPKQLREAAEESISYILTNFVMPERPESFRSYCKKLAWSIRNSLRRGLNGDDGRLDRAGHEATARSKKPDYLSVISVALLCGVHKQRIYEAINEGRLKATRLRGMLRIAYTDAEQFRVSQGSKVESRQMLKELKKVADKRTMESLRKYLYRLRKRGESPETIKKELKNRAIHIVQPHGLKMKRVD